jgi:hypothetical protein
LSIARLINVSISSKTLVPSKAMRLKAFNALPFHFIKESEYKEILPD